MRRVLRARARRERGATGGARARAKSCARGGRWGVVVDDERTGDGDDGGDGAGGIHDGHARGRWGGAMRETELGREGRRFALKSRAVRVNATAADAADAVGRERGGRDDDELIDESALLTELDVNTAPVKYDDCDVGAGKKACKNCTCGRAEAEAAEEATTAASEETFVSACGELRAGRRVSGARGVRTWASPRLRINPGRKSSSISAMICKTFCDSSKISRADARRGVATLRNAPSHARARRTRAPARARARADASRASIGPRIAARVRDRARCRREC